MRLGRLRALGWTVLLSATACADIWGFNDLRSTEDDAGPTVDVTAPEPESGGPDAARDVTMVDVSMNERDVVRPPDVTMPRDVERPEAEAGNEAGLDAEAGSDVVVTEADAGDADGTLPDVADEESSAPDVVDDTTLRDTSASDVEASADVTSGLGTDITLKGTPIALVPASNIAVIDDGVFPPVGSDNADGADIEWDSSSGPVRTDDWVGYAFNMPQTFNALVFQAGIQFGTDGGWFVAGTLNVQVLQGGVWTTVVGATSTPPYPGNDGINFETYTIALPQPVAGTGIRLDGVPGGTFTFVSVGELRVYSP